MGLEPICAVLSEHGVKIAPSTYYDARGRGRPATRVVPRDVDDPTPGRH